MKEKILAGLKTKFANLGFTDKALEGVATFLLTTTTEEGQIDNAVSGAEPLLKAFQGDVDSRVSQALAKAKEDAKKLGGDPPQPPTPPTPPTPPAGETESEKRMRENMEKLMGTVSTLAETVTKMKAGEATKSREQILQAKLEKAPDLFKKMTLELFEAKSFADDAEFDQFVTAKVEEAAGFTKLVNEENLSKLPKAGIAFSDKDGKPMSDFKSMMTSATENKLAEKAQGQPN